MPHKDRARVELADLSPKVEKLATFISESDTFVSLPADEKGRLTRQLKAMQEYEKELRDRVAAF